MTHFPGFSNAAALIADPTRSLILTALLDGRALPAGELADAAGVTPQTASSHLSQLLAGGLLAVEREGRHRYYRLAGAHVAEALETLATIQPGLRASTPRRKPLGAQARELQFCRRCYDHLAGQLGVAVTRGLQARGFIMSAADKQFELSAAGRAWFRAIGLDTDELRPTRRGLARQCLDWTERQHHLAGPLGVGFLATMCENGWLLRSDRTRAIRVTPKGRAALKRHLDVDTGSALQP
jgi:DNA-binding transcriptional ArsR family regulator